MCFNAAADIAVLHVGIGAIYASGWQVAISYCVSCLGPSIQRLHPQSSIQRNFNVFLFLLFRWMHLMRCLQVDWFTFLFSLHLASVSLSGSYCLNLFASAYWDVMTKAQVIKFLVNTILKRSFTCSPLRSSNEGV